MIIIPRAKVAQIVAYLMHPNLQHLTIIELPFSFKIIQTLRDGTATVDVVDKEK